MDYAEIKQKMARTSFASKMFAAYDWSKKTMDSMGLIPVDKLRKTWLPDEIETFVIFSVVTNEWKQDSISDRETNKMLEAIRTYMPPLLKEKRGDNFGEWYVMVTGANQFEGQELSFYRLFRHWYYFTYKDEDIDMSKIFTDKFESPYEEYLAIVSLLWAIECNGNSPQLIADILKKIAHTSPQIIKSLMLTRDQYKEELLQFAVDESDYRYCLRPSYSYPFIEYNGMVYLPTPHLLIQAITSAMMNRLTFGDDNLREQIGKHVIESYLFSIIQDSEMFDEVIAEQEYVVKKQRKRTLDVMTRANDCYILFDSKFFVPKVGLRILSNDTRERELDRIAKHCAQIYDQTKNRFGSEYNYFTCKEINWDKVFGLVVVYTDPVLPLQMIYERVAKLKNISLDSTEYKWLTGHIGIVPMATIEKFCFTQSDMVPLLIEKSKSESIGDIWLSGPMNPRKEAKTISDFREKLTALASEYASRAYGINPEKD